MFLSMNLLAISGSLRAASSNSRALTAVTMLAPSGWHVRAPQPLELLPFFNPDVERDAMPEAARNWRDEVAASDALIISSPEYAHGVTGLLKNALDWLVGGIEICAKPVVIVNATPPAEYAQAQMKETLRVMGATVLDDASIELRLRGSSLDAQSIASDPEMSARIHGMFAALSAHIAATRM